MAKAKLKIWSIRKSSQHNQASEIVKLPIGTRVPPTNKWGKEIAEITSRTVNNNRIINI